MVRTTILCAVGLFANILIGLPAMAQAPAELTLTRIDCGTGATPTDVAQRFTDTFAYKDLKLTFTFSCYVIKHGIDYMVWDTGFAPGTNANAPKVGIADRLKELKVTPEQVKYVGISHFHGDHTGSSRRSPTRPCSSARATGTRSPRRRRWRAPMSPASRAGSMKRGRSSR